MRFEPRLLIWSSTRACAPAPTATIVITAPTPMMMPSIVSAERSLLTRSAASATLQRGEEVHARARARAPCCGRCRGGRRRRRAAACGTRARVRGAWRVGASLPSRNVSRRDANAAMSCSCVTTTIVMPPRLSSCSSAMTSRLVARVERAGRLVGEDQLGVVDQRAGDGHALLLAARQLRRDGGRSRVGEPDLRELLARPGVALGRGHARVEQRQLDVLQRARCAAAG